MPALGGRLLNLRNYSVSTIVSHSCCTISTIFLLAPPPRHSSAHFIKISFGEVWSFRLNHCEDGASEKLGATPVVTRATTENSLYPKRVDSVDE